MKVKATHVQRLLNELAKKTGHSLEHVGLNAISLEIKGLGERYLYELSRKLESEQKKGNSTLNVQTSRLELIARFLGYFRYLDFIATEDAPLDNVLAGLVGNYYSFVRGNRSDTAIIQSPVRILQRDKRIWFELQGPMRKYEGPVELVHGCLFILMTETGGKQFHHVYKVGTRERPPLLQGIFSGVSTVFEPIGGRAVLVRSEEKWEAMNGAEWHPSSWQKILPVGGRELVNYFRKYEDNNLSIQKVVTFSFKDLSASKKRQG